MCSYSLFRFIPHHRTPQHKPCPPSSLCSTPSKKKPGACNYNAQLRIAMEISAQEQEKKELWRQQEEEELQRIIQLSLMEKWELRNPAGVWREGLDQGHMGEKGSTCNLSIESTESDQNFILYFQLPNYLDNFMQSNRLLLFLPLPQPDFSNEASHGCDCLASDSLFRATWICPWPVPVYNQQYIQ